MSQFNTYQLEQNSKKQLIEAWHIACEENIRLMDAWGDACDDIIKMDNKIVQLEKAIMAMDSAGSESEMIKELDKAVALVMDGKK